MRNYFADLELSVDATFEDVRHAYKRLSRRYHPDLNPLDSSAEEIFKRIREAYDALGSQTRIERVRKKVLNEETTKISYRPKDIFSALPVKVEKPKEETRRSSKAEFKRKEESLDIHLVLPLTEDETTFGGRQKFQFQFEKPCSECRGSGMPTKPERVQCRRCDGLGYYLINRGANRWKKNCENCGGRGFALKGPCPNCHGRGKILQEQFVDMKIEKGAKFSDTVCIKELGNFSYDGKRRGDLWVQLTRKR